MDRRSVLALLAAVTISCDPFPCLAAQCTDGASRDNSLWVEKVLERMQRIKPGMTRKPCLRCSHLKADFQKWTSALTEAKTACTLR
jgi:hypothetical protein